MYIATQPISRYKFYNFIYYRREEREIRMGRQKRKNEMERKKNIVVHSL